MWFGASSFPVTQIKYRLAMRATARGDIGDSKVKKTEKSFQTVAAPKNDPVWLKDEKIMQLVSKKKPWEEVEIRFWSQGVPSLCTNYFEIKKIWTQNEFGDQWTMSEYDGCSSECLWFEDSTWYRCFLLKSNTDCSGWCGYMKGGLPERVPALPILMLISSSSCCSEASSAFSFICLASWGRVKAKWGSVPTPCRWQKGCKRLQCNLEKKVNEIRWFVVISWPKIAWHNWRQN